MEYKKFVMLVGVLSTMAVVQVDAADFRDVPKKHWAFDEVHWLRADGMLEGWGGKFHGKRQFTRYEMAKVLSRYMGKYDAEKKKVEAQLGQLRSEDQQQRARLDDLGGRTEALERRLGIQPPRGVASPTAIARPERTDVTVDATSTDPGAVSPDMVAGPPPSLLAPMETAPDEALDPAEAEAVERLATPEETQPATPKLSLSERIAAMRRRLEESRRARQAPGGTGSGAEAEASGSASLPGMEAPPEAAPEPMSDEELSETMDDALGETAPAPTTQGGSSADGSASLSPDQTSRYDAIRQRYLRLMRASGKEPPATAPTPEPTLPSMTGGESSDFDFDASGGDDAQPLPGGSQPLPGSGSQPLPGMDDGSAPLPGMDDAQPLPGLSSTNGDEDYEMELPEVGLGYAEGAE